MKKNYFIKTFLDNSEVDILRVRFKDNLDLEKINNLDLFLNFEEGKMIFNEKLINIIEENLGLKNFVFLNIVKVQKRITNTKLENTGWHKDFGESPEQMKILSKKKNFIFKVGIYLQRNKKNFGGGIDLLKSISFDNLKNDNSLISFLRRVYYFFLVRFFDNTMNSQKGDVVGFNGLIYHRTTPIKFVDTKNFKANFNIYFLLTNLETIKDALQAYDKKLNKNKYEYLGQNMTKKNLGNKKIFLLSREYSRFVENILGD